MTVTLDLPDDLAARLAALPDADRFAAAVLAEALAAGNDPVANNPVHERPMSPPEWVLALRPRNPPTDGTNGLHRVFGKWPGEENEQQLLALERRLDDEDADFDHLDGGYLTRLRIDPA